MTEAYLGDVVVLFKRTACWSDYRVIEFDAIIAVADRFGLSGCVVPAAVVRADLRMCATEVRDLMAKSPRSWKLGVRPYAERIEPWRPAVAERRFLAEAKRLGLR